MWWFLLGSPLGSNNLWQRWSIFSKHHWQWRNEEIPLRNDGIAADVVRRVSSTVESWRRERPMSNSRPDPSRHLQMMDNYEENKVTTHKKNGSCHIPFAYDMIKFIMRTIIEQCLFFAFLITCLCFGQTTKVRLVKGNDSVTSFPITARRSFTFKLRNLSMIGSCVRKRMSLAR